MPDSTNRSPRKRRPGKRRPAWGPCPMKHLRSIDMSDGVRASAPGPASSSQARADTSRRILIVEDNAFVADQCESALAAAGYEVVAVVPTAEAAVEAASAQKPDLVLMDIYLAGPRDGVDAAVDIFEGRGIRSVFVSALFDRAIEDRAR